MNVLTVFRSTAVIVELSPPPVTEMVLITDTFFAVVAIMPDDHPVLLFIVALMTEKKGIQK